MTNLIWPNHFVSKECAGLVDLKNDKLKGKLEALTCVFANYRGAA